MRLSGVRIYSEKLRHGNVSAMHPSRARSTFRFEYTDGWITRILEVNHDFSFSISLLGVNVWDSSLFLGSIGRKSMIWKIITEQRCAIDRTCTIVFAANIGRRKVLSRFIGENWKYKVTRDTQGVETTAVLEVLNAIVLSQHSRRALPEKQANCDIRRSVCVSRPSELDKRSRSMHQAGEINCGRMCAMRFAGTARDDVSWRVDTRATQYNREVCMRKNARTNVTICALHRRVYAAAFGKCPKSFRHLAPR